MKKDSLVSRLGSSFLILAVLGSGVFAAMDARGNVSRLEEGFRRPPDSARPWVYWFWLNGNITREGITADLEAMKRVGIGGVLIMEVDQGAPLGPVAFASLQWRKLFRHVVSEAQRLGLEVNMNNDAGWNGSGGPWIKPEQSMQKVVWTETGLRGPLHFEGTLAEPQAVAGFYRDISVLAFPETGLHRIDNIAVKACYNVGQVSPVAPTDVPPNMAIDRARIADISEHMDKNGHLAWDVPAGKWTVVRFGHTSTGAENAPSPASGRGLECDKLSKQGIEANFAGLMAKLIEDVGPAAGKALVGTHIDSWEVGAQNWTARMRDEFRNRRGYDPMPYLPAMTGRVIQSSEFSERFLWDLRQTISDLIVENYAGHMRTLARRHGLRLSIEAYGGPCDDIPYAGRADEPMCEFWIGKGMMQTCKEMASAAHTYGKPILGAEAFTAASQEKWKEHPATIKALGDRAFCDGVNRFVFHRYAMQPWQDRWPGMTMGPWGLHYERTATWWDESAAWHEYLARCQFMLRQGRFVADVCYLQPEAAPQGFVGHQRLDYDYDNCSDEVILTRMSVKDGRLVLPDGMSYRLLVLPKVETMTPQLLRRIKELVEAGAVVMGSPPVRSPSLSDYPRCDEEVKTLADELWGGDEPSAELSERPYGKGRLFCGGRLADDRNPVDDQENPLERAKWIWHPQGHPAVDAPVGIRYFRKTFSVEASRTIDSARLLITADNGFEMWVNGRSVGAGYDYRKAYAIDVTPLLKPGMNILAASAENGGDKPNPAGLIGALTIRFHDGTTTRYCTDRSWEVSTKTQGNWTSAATDGGGWKAAMELGSMGMGPWGRLASELPEAFPDASIVSDVLGRTGLLPDFETDGGLRYIHRRDGDTDIFFVANDEQNWVGANCTFRVSGKVPEMWDPLTGRTAQQAIYWETDKRTTMPIWLEPNGSLFVVFRAPAASADTRPHADPTVAVSRNGKSILPQPGHPLAEPPPIELFAGHNSAVRSLARQPGRYELKTAGGKRVELNVAELPEPFEITGPWELRFTPGWGAPERITLVKLISWSEHSDPGVRYFSGAATYRKVFSIPPEMMAQNQRVFLDLGRVQVIAAATLNGHDLGILWKPPYRVDISDSLKPGENELEVRVVNLWPNRMIGDAQLPEDSDRNANGTLKAWPQWLQDGKPSPTGLYTFTTWPLWKKDDPLLESGLLGPVRLETAASLEQE